MKLRVGSRESLLAIAQSNIVIDKIKEHNTEIEIELITMKTTGDILLDKSLDEIGGKGVFLKELEIALLKEEVDITVHSFKDMPMETTPELPIVCLAEREDPRDALLLPAGVDNLDLSKPIGCSSKRRRVQLKRLYPGCRVEPIRGNLTTRLEKLDRGEYSALVLAYAGLIRIGLSHRASRIFETHEMIPAAGQGVIAVQAKQGFKFDIFRYIEDKNTVIASSAERSFVTELGGGCTSPVGAYAFIDSDTLELTGLYVPEDLSAEYIKSVKIQLTGNSYKDIILAEELGVKLALELKGKK